MTGPPVGDLREAVPCIAVKYNAAKYNAGNCNTVKYNAGDCNAATPEGPVTTAQ